ncbi:MAG: CoA-binding protein [Rhodocyclaceae bacterium]|nr:CoA-binding protein [Rhodocyclaceae bacterium]
MSDYCSAKPGSQQFPGQTSDLIRSILRRYRKVAMVGLSGNSNRPSYFAATYLKDYGYEITPVNPAYDEIMGLNSYASLEEVPAPLEIVDIFRKPEEVPALVDQAIRLGAKVIWMQLGIVHMESREKALAAGLEVVMDRCMKIEHARYHGGMGVTGLRTGVISAKKGRI